jgi:predicted component of type VI protein secretion system
MGIAIEVRDTRTGVSEVVFFRTSPVRIGRNALNDLLLDEPSVSQWHAQIVFDDQAVWLVDVGSSNGSQRGGAAVVAHQPAAVAPDEIVEVGPMHLRVRRGEGTVRAPAGAMSEAVLTMLTSIDVASDARSPLRSDSSPGTGGNAHDDAATALASSAVVQLQYLRTMLAALAPARERYLDTLREQIEALPPSSRSKLIPQVAREYPELARCPEFLAIADEHDAGAVAIRAPSAREWAEELVGAPVEGAGGEEIADARVLARVAALLQTFTQSLFELRRVKHRVTRDLGLGEPVEPQPRSGRDILAWLLDFGVDGEERAQALVREFADLAVHQLALVSAVREGVRALIDEIAPETIASGEARSRSARGRSWRDLLPLTGMKLWERYRVVHGELAEGERYARTIFGARFAKAYLSSTGTMEVHTVAGPEHGADAGAIPVTRGGRE